MTEPTRHSPLRRTLLLGLLAGLSLTMFLIEAQFPLPVPLPGVKLGLANLVTLFVISRFSVREAAAVMLIRILLGNLLTGQLVSFSYALAGGILSLAAMAVSHRLLKGKSLWFTSVMGGVSHNLGQMIAALCYLGWGGVVYYVPFLLVSGILMGLLIGLVTQLLLRAWVHTGEHPE